MKAMIGRTHYYTTVILLMLVVGTSGSSTLQSGSTQVTMCDIYNDPQQFSGRMIKVRATITGYSNPTLERPSFSPQEECAAKKYMIVALELPQDLSPKPDFDMPPEDTSFQKYQQARRGRNRIEATLEGRLDATFVWENRKRIRIGPGKGYGKNHSADARLILHRISDVSIRHIPKR